MAVSGGKVSKNTEKYLRDIASSLKELVRLQKGSRKGVLTEPLNVNLSEETLKRIAQASTSSGSQLLTEKDNK